jgi:hypothetical protein
MLFVLSIHTYIHIYFLDFCTVRHIHMSTSICSKSCGFWKQLLAFVPQGALHLLHIMMHPDVLRSFPQHSYRVSQPCLATSETGNSKIKNRTSPKSHRVQTLKSLSADRKGAVCLFQLRQDRDNLCDTLFIVLARVTIFVGQPARLKT